MSKGQKKGSGQKGNNTNKQQQLADVAADALEDVVRSIELSEEDFMAGAKKRGMTKAQAAEAYAKLTRAAEMRNAMAARRNLPNDAALQAAFAERKQAERAAWVAAQYVNAELPLDAQYLEWFEAAPGRFVRFEQFDKSSDQMQAIYELYSKELSEPYSSFTYQFFVFGWPDLCVLAYGIEQPTKPEASAKGEFIGAVVSRVSRKAPNHPLRGYVAMLAVKPTFRGARIGSRLVEATVQLMRSKGCDEVSLETPNTNQRALKLYLDLGFAKIKFLPAYYLDGADAYRLKLYLNDFTHRRAHQAEAAAEGTNTNGDEADESAVPPLEEQH